MKHSFGRLVAALGLVSALGGQPPGLAAQSPRPMTLADLVQLPRVTDPQLSPDGGTVAFLIARADWKANRLVPHVWRQATAGGAPVQMTGGDTGETSPRWSPDGKQILFLARRPPDNRPQVFVMPAEGGDARQLTHHATALAAPMWSPAGDSVYFVAEDQRAADPDREKLRDDVYAYDENYTQRHLWRVDVASGAESAITSGDFSVNGYRVARDGQHIVVQRAPTPLAGDSYRSDVWITDATGRTWQQITRNGVDETDAELSPDNTRVLFLAEAGPREKPYYNGNLFLADASGGSVRPLVPDFRYAIDRATWAADGRSILAVVNMGVHTEVFQIGLDGRTRQLTDGHHSIQFWSYSPAARRMVFLFDEPDRVGDVWTLAADQPAAAPTRVTGVYDSLARDFRLPREERVTWKSTDGTTVEGVLFYPVDYTAGTKYPLVVQLHGGPNDSDKFGLGPGLIFNFMPVLTARGYAVLRVNYRGSTGYGNAFFRGVVGGYFAHQPDDVMSGVDALIARGIADADRLGVMGVSAGGHLTNKLVTWTRRFKAASSTAGAANWLSLYAQSDERSNRTVWFGGTPWQRDAAPRFWAESPVKDAWRVTTPTLFFVGENDARVPLPQSIEMFRAIKATGTATRLYVAKGEGHQWNGLRQQLYKANAELEWFEKYLRGRVYSWERFDTM